MAKDNRNDPRMIPTRARCSSVAGRLEQWFQRNGRSFAWRNRSASRYTRVVTEVLVQRTRAEAVDGMLRGFLRRFPGWTALDRARTSTLERVLKPIGLYRRRARSLKGLAKYAAAIRGRFPADRDQLEQVTAVGQYVASAILLFCHGQPEPLLDTNMARVLERYFGPRKLADIRHDPYLQELSRRVVSAGDPVVINWAILDLGAMVCKPRTPECNACPLKRGCQFRKQHSPA
jgi:A/G-specific adenine glycosylase